MQKSSLQIPLIIILPFVDFFFWLFNEFLCLKIIIPFTVSVQSGGVIGAEQENNILFMPVCPGIVLSFETVWLQMSVDKTSWHH